MPRAGRSIPEIQALRLRARYARRRMRRSPVVILFFTLACSSKPVAYHTTTVVDRYGHAEGLLDITKYATSLMRITQDATPAKSPVLSPDGAVLLYQSSAGARWELVGIEPNTANNKKRYSPANATAAAAAWLHDGSAYIFATDAQGSMSLVRSTSAAPDAGVQVLVKGDVAPEADHPSLSSDGVRVVFQTTIKGTHQIAVANLDGTGFNVLGEGETPAWSPDGTMIAFVRKVQGYAQIFTYDATGGTNVAQVTKSAADHLTPAWSPDSSRIVFSSNDYYRSFRGTKDATWNLFAVKIDGTHLHALTKTAAAATTPFWARDGWIYFSSNVIGNQDIWRLRPAGVLEKASAQPNGPKMPDAKLPNGPGLKGHLGDVPQPKDDEEEDPAPKEPPADSSTAPDH